jgi:hypothetical protein
VGAFNVMTLPRSLRFVAGAEETAGQSGPFGFAQGRRDDRVRQEQPKKAA